jgi:hypothetical protein
MANAAPSHDVCRSSVVPAALQCPAAQFPEIPCEPVAAGRKSACDDHRRGPGQDPGQISLAGPPSYEASMRFPGTREQIAQACLEAVRKSRFGVRRSDLTRKTRCTSPASACTR